MTQPTQAQIEAAAKALAYHEAYVWGSSGLDHDCLREKAKAILTAAAQVGEPTPFKAATIGELERELEYIEAATIERCAQVAEEWLRENGYDLRQLELVAAIRKLKDAL